MDGGRHAQELEAHAKVAPGRPRTAGAPRAAVACAALWLASALPACASSPAPGSFREQRLELVAAIEAGGVRDSLTLAALRAVPREAFVPPTYRRWAYLDQALPIAHGQTISQPTIVALMTEALRPRAGMRVLEVGTGSGYQAAVLAAAGCRVYTVEIIAPLADSARALLGRLGYAGIEVRHGDGYLGWPEAAPFDAIIVTAAPERVPPALIEQLGPGGRLVAPVGAEHEVQDLILMEKDAGGRLRRTVLLPVRFVPMRGGKR